MDETNKNIDESWKEAAEKEKAELKDAGGFVPPVPDFTFFITTLSLQASIALGQVPNPATNKAETDLTQAKFLIDTLGMLKEKTKNNLSAEEGGFLENMLYELRTLFIAAQNKGAK